ncbi:GNAT family N-acetyltransferase [Actinomycetospora cinnamomea]|uniref:Acetyltransferase (GNAT) family protein n=1 Tax=Actinomycetospora cinnamomea TaxID=663609 RepID=A0A2U1E9B0_9PSEU|nr:GNAT family N-acetyltransferase [Actinomycetospora cinnamomea]PVY96534.1 acetyltransferase (GNAT) family protein [Actinomycetospora cinnamomea]
MTTAPCVVAALTVADAGEALTVQYAAYLSEGRRYGTTGIPPLRETVAELAADLERADVRAFGAWAGVRLVGSVRLRGERVGTGSGCAELARFSVAPDVQGHGIGRALMERAHAELATGDVTWLVTGARSEENLRLYRRAGYEETGRLSDAAGVELLRLERLAP